MEDDKSVLRLYVHLYSVYYTKNLNMSANWLVYRYWILGMQISNFSYANMDFFKKCHIRTRFLWKDPVLKYEFLWLFIYPWNQNEGLINCNQNRLIAVHWANVISELHWFPKNTIHGPFPNKVFSQLKWLRIAQNCYRFQLTANFFLLLNWKPLV